MNIFTKADITRTLTIKVKEGEIRSFSLTDNHLRIQKSKRTGFTFKLKSLYNFITNLLNWSSR
jgi:hypothetical protein